MMAIWKFAPALAAGNTVVLKPRTPPRCRRCCWPSWPRSSCRRACSTWSPATGTPAGPWCRTRPRSSCRSPARCARAARWPAPPRPMLKRTHLELGGKAPVVVFDDADLEAAAEAIAVAGYFNAGPGLHRGDPRAGRPRHLRRLRGRDRRAGRRDEDRRARRRGRALRPAEQRRPAGPGHRLPRPAARPREVNAGGARVGDRGYFYSPTVVSGLRQEDETIQDEVFGPVITVQRFTDEDEAVRWANGVEYGLSSSVWTRTTAGPCA